MGQILLLENFTDTATGIYLPKEAIKCCKLLINNIIGVSEWRLYQRLIFAVGSRRAEESSDEAKYQGSSSHIIGSGIHDGSSQSAVVGAAGRPPTVGSGQLLITNYK